ncbi:MAG: hypothetical protein H6732_04160 [Alphaproteobacteria bacterium]|nr:hypothetical protein [Alphaproteobacteria bacterium]
MPRSSREGLVDATNGDFDFMQAIQDGVDAVSRNWLTWILGGALAGMAVGASIVACIVPVLVVGPAIAWGFTRYVLDTLDGEADWTVMFTPLQRLGDVWAPMAGYFVLMALIGLPPTIANQVLGFAMDAPADPMMAAAVTGVMSMIFSLLWGFVTVRFLPSVYLIVERNRGPVDALAEAWELTATCWIKLYVFQVVMYFAIFAAVLMCILPAIPVGMVFTAALASIYRQLTGPPPLPTA